MEDRTDARDALVQVCWYLNYHEGDTLSINRIAEETDLAWATVYNTINTLEKLQRIAPSVSHGDDGVEVGDTPERTTELLEDEALAATAYLFLERREDGNIRDAVQIDDHTALAERREGLENAASLGWVRLEEDTVALEPTGIGVVGPMCSKIENCD